MSRIGKSPVSLPKGVVVEINRNSVKVKGTKGELQQDFPPEIEIKQEAGQVLVTRPSDSRFHRAKHGLVRALLNNMVVGVSQGFTRELKIEGVGYKANVQDKNLVLSLGFSHPVVFEPPVGVSFSVDKTGTQLLVNGVDKAIVGEMAARIRRMRPPEPYKGKGIRYLNEVVLRKAGKTGKK